MKTKLLFLTAVFIFTGCSISTSYLQEGSTKKAAYEANKVKIYSGDLSQEYEVIGSIAVDSPGDAKSAVETAKKKAASIGANAVIMAKLTVVSSPSSRVGLSGVAVWVK